MNGRKYLYQTDTFIKDMMHNNINVQCECSQNVKADALMK